MSKRFKAGVATLAGLSLFFARPAAMTAEDVPEAVDGAAIIGAAVASCFPIFGQCLEVSIAIHVGGAHIVKGVSGEPGPGPRGCQIPGVVDEEFKSCPPWPDDMPADISGMLDTAVLLEVDLIELNRVMMDSVPLYFEALGNGDCACAQRLYDHMQGTMANINKLCDRLAFLYAQIHQRMLDTGTDYIQSMDVLLDLLATFRDGQYPPEDQQLMPEIHTRPEEANTFLEHVARYTDDELLKYGGLTGQREFGFSDGIRNAQRFYELYNPQLRLPPPCAGGCNGAEVLKKAKCTVKNGAVKKAIVLATGATPGVDYTCDLATGQSLTQTAPNSGKVKFTFSGTDAPPLGPNTATVCDQSKDFTCR